MDISALENLDACKEALKWAETQSSPQEAWNNCSRGDWMLWLLGTLCGPPESQSRKDLVFCTCQCVRLALPYVKNKDQRPLTALETAERWSKNQDSLENVKVAVYAAANAVAYAAYAAYAANAANAAYVAYAANAAYAAAGTKRKEILKQCADIVRKYYPEVPNV